MDLNQFKLLEVFGQEPIVIDVDAEIYLYSTADTRGDIFTMYVSTYESKVIVRLEHSESGCSIFDVAMSDVHSIGVNRQEVTFYGNDKVLASINIGPTISLDLDV